MTEQQVQLTIIVLPVTHMLTLVTCDFIKDAHVCLIRVLIAQVVRKFQQLSTMLLVQVLQHNALKQLVYLIACIYASIILDRCKSNMTSFALFIFRIIEDFDLFLLVAQVSHLVLAEVVDKIALRAPQSELGDKLGQPVHLYYIDDI